MQNKFLLLCALCGIAITDSYPWERAMADHASMIAMLVPIPPTSFTPFSDGKDSILMNDMSYRILDTNYVIVVPAGFVTDFASTPRALWAVLPPNGTYQRAAVVHDYLYWNQSCTRDEADMILRLAMYESDVLPAAREIIYQAVLHFGSVAWNENARERASKLPRFVPLDELPYYSLTSSPPATDPLFITALDTWDTYRIRLKNAGVPIDPALTPRPAYCAAAPKLWKEIEEKEKQDTP